MKHEPVLVDEIIKLFQPVSGDSVLDATLGNGGHAAAYLIASEPNGTVTGIDADQSALDQARQHLTSFGSRVTYVSANFVHLSTSVSTMYTHILFDLGLGSHQLAVSGRGFSFQSNGPLDMSYGSLAGLPDADVEHLNMLTQRLRHLPIAIEIIMGLSALELTAVLRHYGEEKYAKSIASAIKRDEPKTTIQLADTVERAVPQTYVHGRIHPATRTFQALRLAVNRELEALSIVLPQALSLLAPNGTMAVISFHSLEDRIIKNFFRTCATLSGNLTVLTKRPITATKAEIEQNPRARSAKLRAVQKSEIN